MSSLSGHWKLTKQAVEELRAGKDSTPLMRALPSARLQENAIARDLIDVLILGHWLDFGQQHHFMRRFDGQSPFGAYSEGVEWIRSNAHKSVGLLARRISTTLGSAGARKLQPTFRSTTATPVAAERLAVKVFGGDGDGDHPSWQPLGNAIHALQDSFSPSHAERDLTVGPSEAGVITHVKVYEGKEKKDHEEDDEKWHVKKGDDFSDDYGRLAIEATKALIVLVLKNAADSAGKGPSALAGWDAFRNKWLIASPALRTSRDFAFDFIARFSTRLRAGSSTLTLNMDEEGLAEALLKEVGTDMDRVLEVFTRLDEHHQTDVDDVAEIYVGLVKKQAGSVLEALKGNAELIDLLIRSMDEGWTSAGEKACIEFLKTLKH